MTMHDCIPIWDDGKCILKTKFFLPLSPARFLLGLPTDDDQPKPGSTPLDSNPASLPDNQPTHIPETPGRGRGRTRDPDLGLGPGRPRRGRTPEGEGRRYRGPGEDEDEEENQNLEDQLRRLLDKWNRDIARLRENLHHELLSL
ncbi:E4 early protein [Bos taurus papillomavirus 35]|nr:E4 early protein [Bos taurus papillomavirus 35]